MVYQELYNEYTSLLGVKTDCQNALTLLKSGYISTKTISGKKYAYLQYRAGGKLKSEYIREDDVPSIRAEMDERAHIIKKIRDTDSRLDKIEAAAGILDESLRRNLIVLRRCATMEAMPHDERTKSLAFSNAMTALEGIPASEDTEKNLSRWANGDFSFQESYLKTLKNYHLMKV